MNAQEQSGRWVRGLETLGRGDLEEVGGKNASLGEMIGTLQAQGIRVPGGFATTSAAFRQFVADNDLAGVVDRQIAALRSGETPLPEVGRTLREAFLAAPLPESIAAAVRQAYRDLGARLERPDPDVAVRSSATAEDLPGASFAGQHETFLNVRGEAALLEACRACFASLFTDRAIAYREELGFEHAQVALSVGVQEMVRSDVGAAGVLFTLDPDTGFPGVVVIDANHGLGETVVKGTADPDEYMVFKPLLARDGCRPILEKRRGEKACRLVYGPPGGPPTVLEETSAAERRALVLEDDEILQLARWGVLIEEHYGCPMDIEWARDGRTGQLFIVQARPETAHSNRPQATLALWRLLETGEVLTKGVAVGQSIATGRVRVLSDPSEGDRLEPGDVLVTGRTDPDWGPLVKRASAIVTDHGGRTSHAAIVSRELGIPAVVGTGTATRCLRDGDEVTVSCAEGHDGRVYRGALEHVAEEVDLASLPEPPVRLMLNLASPDAALRWWRLPVRGIGLARMEFVIGDLIQIHPLALTRFDELEDEDARQRIEELTAGYEDRTAYFVERLASGLATIAASQYPEPVIVRLSDFKTNEYAGLIGGARFEPNEENPMLGFRGASRYDSERYADGFALECRAIRRVREVIGLDNLIVMIPFVRSLPEADRVIAALARHGLERGGGGLELYMMCEVPSNVFLAEEFAERFDGFSIGSNDLTQLILGVDRDSAELGPLFDERDPAVSRAIAQVIERAHSRGCPVGICGQAPSDHPDFAQFLVEHGIDSISLNPDSVLGVIRALAAGA